MNILCHYSNVGDCGFIFIIIKNNVMNMFIFKALAPGHWIWQLRTQREILLNSLLSNKKNQYT